MDESPTMTETKPDKILGVNRRAMPSELHGSMGYTVVLISGAIGDYAAYIGMGTDEFVQAQGDKLSFEEANSNFCGSLERKHYRG